MKTIKKKFANIKEKIAKERYTTSFRLKVLIIVCWIVYIACLIIKLCGGNRFEIATSNERFIAVCDYIDNTLWLKITIYACISLIMNTLLALAMMKQKFYTVKQIYIFVPFILTMSIVRVFCNQENAVLTLLNSGIAIATSNISLSVKYLG